MDFSNSKKIFLLLIQSHDCKWVRSVVIPPPPAPPTNPPLFSTVVVDLYSCIKITCIWMFCHCWRAAANTLWIKVLEDHAVNYGRDYLLALLSFAHNLLVIIAIYLRRRASGEEGRARSDASVITRYRANLARINYDHLTSCRGLVYTCIRMMGLVLLLLF